MFTQRQEKINSKRNDLFSKFKEDYEFDPVQVDLLIYKNFSAGFDLENGYPRFLHKIFENQKDSLSYLEMLKEHSLPSKMTMIYNQVLLLFQFLFNDIRGSLKPIDVIEMQNAMDQGRKYWQIDEANTPIQKKLNMQSEDAKDDEIEEQSLLVDDE